MSLGNAAEARCDTSRRKPLCPFLLSPPPPPYRWNCNKLNSAFGNARERYVGSRKLARHDAAEAGLVRFTIGAARVTEPAGSLYRQEPRHPTKLITTARRAPGNCPCFRRTLLLPAYLRPSCPFFSRLRSRNTFEGCDRFASGACLSGELCLDIDRFESPLNIWTMRKRERERGKRLFFEVLGSLKPNWGREAWNMWNTEIKDLYCDRVETWRYRDSINCSDSSSERAIDGK